MNRPCEYVTEQLAVTGALDARAAAHAASCPTCARLVRLPGLIGQASHGATAVEAGPGFQSRMQAGAGARLAARQRTRIWRITAPLVTATAAAALLLWLPGRVAEDTRSAPGNQAGPTAEAVTSTAPAAAPAAAAPALPGAAAPAPAGSMPLVAQLAALSNVSATMALELGPADRSAADIAALAGELALSPAQQKKLRAIVAQAESAETKARAALKAARAALDTKLAQPAPDSAQVSGLIDRIGKLEADVRKARVLGWLRARKVLSNEQRSALAKVQDTRVGAAREVMRNAERIREQAMRDAERALREMPALEQLEALEHLEIPDIDIDVSGLPDGKAIERQVEQQIEQQLQQMEKQLDEQLRQLDHLPELEGLDELEASGLIEPGRADELLRKHKRALEQARQRIEAKRRAFEAKRNKRPARQQSKTREESR